MKFYIVGNQGNMGRRYTAILKHLGHEVYGHDTAVKSFEEKEDVVNPDFVKSCNGIIISTPTESHIEHLKKYLLFKLPVLCEKPFTRDINELYKFEDKMKEYLPQISMVNQYQYLVMLKSQGKTFYDYYNSGKDGKYWDCINIIGLAKGEIAIEAKSPVWTCMINGKKLNLKNLDQAYIDMISDWISHESINDWDYIIRSHEKTNQLYLES
jgi:hypothetical protein